MAKDLHWFKFIITEWTHGDIVLCSLAAQGLFVNIMALYWAKECDLTIKKMRKHFPAAAEVIPDGIQHSAIFQELIEEGVVKIDGEKIRISFMDEQKSFWEETSKVNSENGKKGGRGKRKESDLKAGGKATIKPNESDPQSEMKAGGKARESQREGDKTSLPEKAEKRLIDDASKRITTTTQTSPGLVSGYASSHPKTIKTKQEFFGDLEAYKFKQSEIAEMSEDFDNIPDDQVERMYIQYRRKWKTEDGRKKTPKASEIIDLVYSYTLPE